jgi:hypothetical protein
MFGKKLQEFVNKKAGKQVATLKYDSPTEEWMISGIQQQFQNIPTVSKFVVQLGLWTFSGMSPEDTRQLQVRKKRRWKRNQKREKKKYRRMKLTTFVVSWRTRSWSVCTGPLHWRNERYKRKKEMGEKENEKKKKLKWRGRTDFFRTATGNHRPNAEVREPHFQVTNENSGARCYTREQKHSRKEKYYQEKKKMRAKTNRGKEVPASGIERTHELEHQGMKKRKVPSTDAPRKKSKNWM